MVSHAQSHTPREGARDRETTAIGPLGGPGPDEEAGRASLSASGCNNSATKGTCGPGVAA